ncbi:hypothetical protein ACJZ2D_005544 [Fusarium nematophilum]
MAIPLVAGCIAALREAVISVGEAKPGAAPIEALLVNSAVDMQGTSGSGPGGSDSAAPAVGHAKAWGSILQKAVRNAQGPVTAMLNQLNEVYRHLKQQIGLLETKLIELKSILEEQKKALSASYIGVVGVIAGLATWNVYLIVGADHLFMGGLIAASVSGSEADRAAAAVCRPTRT